MTDRLVLNLAGLRELASSSQVRDNLEQLGPQIVSVAAENAPKLTGAGAASIDYEVVEDDGLHLRVSWDEAHDYMRFAELGDEREAARPFLRPAVQQHYSL